MPRSRDLAIFMPTTDVQTDYFTPCACARGNKDMGVPAAFIYIAPWTGGITSVVENLLHCLSEESQSGGCEEAKQVAGLSP